MEVTGTAAVTGNLIDLAQSGSGKDIDGTSSLWSVSAAGAGIFASLATNTITASATNPSNLTIDATGTGTISLGATSTGGITLTRAVTATASITITGTADANCLTVTAGDILISNGKIALTNDDTDTAVAVIANSVTTGNAVSITANGITTGAMLYLAMTEAGITSGNGAYIECYDSTAGATQFFVSDNGATTITGSATGTSALTLTAGDITVSDGVLSITQSGDATAFKIVADSQVATTVMDINADGITSGVLLHLDTTAATFTGKYIQCYDGAADDFSVGEDGAVIITNTVAGTVGLTITHGSTTGDALQIACSALTTGDALQITSTAETLAAGELLKINNTEDGDISATPKTGNLCSITSSVTMTTASASLDYDAFLITRSNIANQGAQTLTAAGSVLKLMNTSTNTAGTCTDTTICLEIEQVEGGTAAPTGDVVKVTSVGVGAKALNIISASTTVSDVLITGSGVKANNKAILEIAGTGATAAGGSLFRVAQTSGTPAAATSYLVDFDFSGATMTNNPVAVIINAGASTAAGLQITSSGAEAGGLLELNSTATGALGAILKFDQTANSAANADVIGRLLFTAQDDANAAETYGRIDCIIRDIAAANPDASLNFLVDRAGTVTLAMTLGWDTVASAAVNGAMIGDGAATAIVSSQGAYDLTLETNGGTNSSVITITDGANGDITLTPNGTGLINLTAPTYGQITSGADGDNTLTPAMCGLYLCPNTVARTLTLPAAAGNAGLWYTIKKTNAAAAAITIEGNAAETVDGAANSSLVDALYDSLSLVCDGSNWHIVNKMIS